jgi:hypothetical protein
MIACGREWWEKLTGLKNMHPKDVDEAFEMRNLVVKPVTVSYRVVANWFCKE